MEDERPVGHVRILVEVVDASGIDRGRAPNQPMHFVALADQELGKIRAVLPGYPSDKSASAGT
jgi:hypothetical protein